MDATILTRLLQYSFSRDLLNKQWQKLVRGGDHPHKGYCYVATEALYHLWGHSRGYKPHYLVIGKGKRHWFLKNPETGDIQDPTAGQFSKTPPYQKAKGCGFLSQKPSKRALILLKRVASRATIVA